MDSASPMALCLVGQTELRSRLRLRAFAAISQRVNLRFHLTGLPEPETKAYIQQHLKAAGLGHPLFSDDAVRLIYHFTKGIPRRVNNLGTACLLAGYIGEKPLIDEDTVKKALAELEDDLSACPVALPAGGGEAGLKRPSHRPAPATRCGKAAGKERGKRQSCCHGPESTGACLPVQRLRFTGGQTKSSRWSASPGGAVW